MQLDSELQYCECKQSVFTIYAFIYGWCLFVLIHYDFELKRLIIALLCYYYYYFVNCV